MNLYEARTGMTGESYVRCYVWAESEFAARLLVLARHGEGCRVREIELLFGADSGPFCTALSDNGWEP